MHNYTKKIERKQQLKEGKLGAKLVYFVAAVAFLRLNLAVIRTKNLVK